MAVASRTNPGMEIEVSVVEKTQVLHTQEESDRELLVRSKDGDWDAFDALVDRYQRRLVGYLRSQSGELELSRDLAQETFLKLIHKPPTLREQESLKPWLFTVARNLLRDHWRRSKRMVNHENVQEEADHVPSAADCLGREDDVLHVRRLLGKLPKEELEVVHLRIYGDMTFADISRTLEIPLGTALWRMTRAVNWLREWWHRSPDTETDGGPA